MIAKRTGQSAQKNIQGFPFHSIFEHIAGIIETDISLIPLLLKVFAIFRCIYFNTNITKRKKLESIFIKHINCDRSTGLL